MENRLIPLLVDDSFRHDSVLIFPGGGYDHVSLQKEGETVAKALNKEHLNAFVLNYRVYPHSRKEIMADAVDAVRKVRHLFMKHGVSGNKLAIMGFSAGGHLAMMEAEHYRDIIMENGWSDSEDCRPDAVVLCYPVVTFSESCVHVGSRMNFLGHQDAADDDLRIMYSAEKGICSGLPPVFLWHCAGDDSVPMNNSILLRDALDRVGVDNRLKIYQGGSHGLGLAQDHAEISGWFSECITWLCEKGFQ